MSTMDPNPLFRLLLVNGLIGAGAALAMVAGLVVLNAHGLRSLLMGSDVPWVALAVLTFGLVVTLASVAMGIGIMRMPGRGNGRDDGDDDDRGGRAHVGMPAPVRVAARR